MYVTQLLKMKLWTKSSPSTLVKYTSLHIKAVCPKYAEIKLWGLIIGPFLIPATEALVFLLRQLVFEKGKEDSPPSLATAIGVRI